MFDTSYKMRLVEHCIDLQRTSVDNARNAMEEAQEEANAYGPPKDRYDGFRNQQSRKRDLYGRQLEQAIQNIALLSRVEAGKQYDEIEFGSLIITDSSKFLVAVGIGLVTFEGEEVAVISMLVPIYHAMKGKRVGDHFTFREMSYKVKDIS